MKKFIFLFVLFPFYFLLFSYNCVAQWQQSLSTTYEIGSIFISRNNIFAGSPGGGVYSSSGGVFLSSNNGNTWSAVNNGFTNPIIISSLAIKGDTILAGSNGSGLYYSINNGSNWDTLNTGHYCDLYGVSALAIKGDTIFAGTGGDGVFMSPNNGSSWDSINTGLSGNVYRLIDAFAINGSNIFVGTGTSLAGGGVFLYSNITNSWSFSGLAPHPINAFAVKNDTIYAGTNDVGIFMSTDNGTTWNMIGTGLIGNGRCIFSMMIYKNYFFIGTPNKVYLSKDDGYHWVPLDSNLTAWDIYSLAIDSNYVFAGTESGIWRLPLSYLTASINEINNNESNIVVYPSPAKNNITIDVSATLNIPATIEITNIEGQLIETLATIGNKTNIDISLLAKGMYFIKVKTEKGVAVKKFIKE